MASPPKIIDQRHSVAKTCSPAGVAPKAEREVGSGFPSVSGRRPLLPRLWHLVGNQFGSHRHSFPIRSILGIPVGAANQSEDCINGGLDHRDFRGGDVPLSRDAIPERLLACVYNGYVPRFQAFQAVEGSYPSLQSRVAGQYHVVLLSWVGCASQVGYLMLHQRHIPGLVGDWHLYYGGVDSQRGDHQTRSRRSALDCLWGGLANEGKLCRLRGWNQSRAQRIFVRVRLDRFLSGRGAELALHTLGSGNQVGRRRRGNRRARPGRGYGGCPKGRVCRGHMNAASPRFWAGCRGHRLPCSKRPTGRRRDDRARSVTRQSVSDAGHAKCTDAQKQECTSQEPQVRFPEAFQQSAHLSYDYATAPCAMQGAVFDIS